VNFYGIELKLGKKIDKIRKKEPALEID